MQRTHLRDIAVEYLDAAVCEHLDHGRHFAAYNLAAVAEELFSRLLEANGRMAQATLKISMAEAVDEALGLESQTEGVWRRRFLELKNSIKHLRNSSDPYVSANMVSQARQKIGDAIADLERLGCIKSAHVKRFDRYRLTHRSVGAL